MQANAGNANFLKNILDQYCLASCQLVSKQKSSIFFGPNTLVKKREEICIVLDIMTEVLIDKYVCLPAIVGMDRSDCFQFLVDRVCKRIKGWMDRFLLAGGKEVLLKAIA
jgi:hypothetical protein